MPGQAVLYSDGRMRPPDWRRENYQVWEAITLMFAEKLADEYLRELHENEMLREMLIQRSISKSAGAI